MGAKRSARSDELKSLQRSAADLNSNGVWTVEAIEVNAMIIALDPSDAAAHARRGKCYYRRGDLEEAEADYSRALALTDEGSSIQSHISQAIAEIRAEIEERATRAQREREERQRKERELAEEMARQKEVLEALASAGEAIETAREARASSQPDEEFAAAAYRRALELDPSRLDVAVEWAALLRLAEPDRALVIHERVLELDPGHRPAEVGKAAILVDLGEADEGLRICERLLTHHPDDSYARRVKARAHAARGEMPEAVWNFENS